MINLLAARGITPQPRHVPKCKSLVSHEVAALQQDSRWELGHSRTGALMPSGGQEAAEPFSFTITPRQLQELTELAGELHAEAERCRDADRWTPALISLGGSAEAALLATACVFEPELRAAGLWDPPRGDPTRWSLGELGNIARKAGWLPTTFLSTAGKPSENRSPGGKNVANIFAVLNEEIGDALRFVERLRNMVVHPGAFVREPLRPDPGNDEHMRQTYELMDGILAYVFDHLATQIQTLAR